MNKFFTLISLVLLSAFCVKAQTTIYSENFEGVTHTWSLSTVRTIGGLTSTPATGPNDWVVNNIYAGGCGYEFFGFCLRPINATPAEPGGISSANGKYMHILGDLHTQTSNPSYNSNVNPAGDSNVPGNQYYFTEMASDISTLGQTGVQLTYWWLNVGDVNNYAQMFYSTDGGANWTLATNNMRSQNTWTQATYPASPGIFDNLASLRIGFRCVTIYNLSVDAKPIQPSIAIDDVIFTSAAVATEIINTDVISPLSYCAGTAISVPFTATGTFNVGNIFTAQLSDAAGSFAAPVTLGTISSTTSGNISGTIPANITTGSGYRVRVVSSNPVVNGSNNGTNITITAQVTPVVTLTPNSGLTICQGANASFTAAPTTGGGIAPTYQWKVNSTVQGSATTTFSSTSLANGDVVTVTMTTNASCVTSNTATAFVTMTVNPTVTPIVMLTPNNGITICAGTNASFTAAPTSGGGTTPTYQWKVNSTVQGATSTSFSGSSLVNGDVVTVTMTSNATCASPATGTAFVTMTVNPTVIPVVTLTPNSGTTICAGANASFTAAPTSGGGTTPTYQWKVNSTVQGATSTSFSSTTLVNGDVVTVTMASNAACASPTTATAIATMTVNNNVSPLVNLTPDNGTTICQGANASFTASPVAGAGNAPAYQWKVNSTVQGATSTSFSSTTLNNGDMVMVIMTSNDACAAPSTATATAIMTVNNNVTPVITLTPNNGTTICQGANASFTANPGAGAGNAPTYQWKVNTTVQGSTSTSFSSTTLVNSDVVTVTMTSNAACVSPTTATATATITVNPSITPVVTVTPNSGTTICLGANASFTANPGAGAGNAPTYQWKVNSTVQGTTSTSFSSTILNNNDVVTVTMTSNASCASPVTAIATATMTVNPLVTPVVTVTPNSGTTICQGANASFTANPGAGAGNAPTYQWKVNTTVQGSTSTSFSSATLNNGDVVTITMTSNAACASPTTATATATMTVNPLVIPVVTITPNSGTTICQGANASFTANPGAGAGNAPTYQWKVNTTVQGSTSTSFSSTTLNNNDVVTVTMTSNAACASPTTATATATMTVNPLVIPVVTITPNSGTTICQGANASFTANPGAGAGNAPTYQWKVNTTVQGSTSTSFSSTTLNNGDAVTVTMTSNATCASPVTATATATMTVNNNVTPVVTLTPNSGTTICQGANASFTANPGAGAGNAPTYQWKVNTTVQVSTSTSFSSTTLINGDVVTVTMTSNAACISSATATATVTMTVNNNIVPIVTLTPNNGTTICQGANASFTANPGAGAGNAPTYQWKVNSNIQGSTSAAFSSAALSNGDVVTVIMTSNAACVSPSTATASAAITVNSNVTPVVTLLADNGTTICQGGTAGFTAVPSSNAGNAPSYQWKVNSNIQGASTTTFSGTSLNNGDIVTVTMTSNAACLATATATASATITVTSSVIPSVSIISNNGTSICQSASASFTANALAGAGNNPTYQWKVNSNIQATTSGTYAGNNFSDGDIITVTMTSNAACASTPTATATVTLTVINNVTPVVTLAPDNGTPICQNTSASFTANPGVGAGNAPTYQWKVNSIIQGATSTSFSSTTLSNGDVVSVTMSSNAACAAPATATASATMTVTSNVTPVVTLTSNNGSSICQGTNASFTANPGTGAGNTPAYQWKVNTTLQGSTSASFSSTTLNNGDAVTVTMTSNAACATPITATATATITVNNNVTPVVTLTPNNGTTICKDANASFTANPVTGAGNAPTYEWKVNTTVQGSTSASFSGTTLNNGDNVTVTMTSNAVCTTQPTASASVTMIVNNIVTPAVTLTANNGTIICDGSLVSFTANPVTGSGSTPSYQWKINNNIQGSTSSSFSTTSLGNGDAVTITMTSSDACASPSTATASAIIIVANNIPPAIALIANNGIDICKGSTAGFTVNPTAGGGNVPVYEWKINNDIQGSTSNTFSSAAFNDGDIVTVTMTTDAKCVSTPTVSTSVTMNVIDNVTPLVTISANPGTKICKNAPVTFSAQPINGGNTPAYQWKVNGNIQGATDASYSSSALGNNDEVSVTMTSTQECVTAAEAEKTVTVTVIDKAESGTVSAVKDTICEGTIANLSTAGSSGGLQWQSSANIASGYTNLSGATNVSYISTPLSNDTYFRTVADNGYCSDTSSAFHLLVAPAPVAAFSYLVSGHEVTFDADASSGASSYSWNFGDGKISADKNPVHVFDTVKTHQVCLTVKNSSNCNYTLCQNVTSLNTGVSTPPGDISWKVYPNPADEVLYIEGSLLEKAIAIEVYDVLARKIYSKEISNKTNNIIKLDASALKAGLYFIKVRTAGYDFIKSFVKQ